MAHKNTENALAIDMIGDWVPHTACQEAARLPQNLVMAVNASPLQFRKGSFLRSIEDALAIANLPANRLEIEITEGVLLKNGEVVVTILGEQAGTHRMGCAFERTRLQAITDRRGSLN